MIVEVGNYSTDVPVHRVSHEGARLERTYKSLDWRNIGTTRIQDEN
jgi:hypothetical protein